MTTDLKLINQSELLQRARELRDRVEISMHKLGRSGRSYHNALNSIVAGLSQENAIVTDDNQPSLFDKPLIPRKQLLGKQPKPVKATAPKRKIELNPKPASTRPARRTRDTEDVAIRSIIGVRDRFWETAKKSGATNSEIRDQLDKMMPESGSQSGPGQLPISFRRNGLRVWFTAVEPRKGVAPALHGIDLVNRVRRIMNIPPAGKPARDARVSNTTPKPKRKPVGEFMAPMQPDEVLAAVVGSKAMPRTEITKKLWDYIKNNGLQDKKNQRQINADDKLTAVFGKSVVTMFEMNKLLQKHLKKVSA